jgi:hypothetical protein
VSRTDSKTAAGYRLNLCIYWPCHVSGGALELTWETLWEEYAIWSSDFYERFLATSASIVCNFQLSIPGE